MNPPLLAGEKCFILLEAGKDNKAAKTKIAIYSKEWDFEELSNYLDQLEDMIWEQEYPEEAMLKKYLSFTHSEGDRIPQSIRVPNAIREIIQHEDELRREYRRKSESQRRGRKPRAKAKGEKQ